MNSVDLIKKLCKERKIPISRLERELGYGNGYIGQLRKGTLPSDRAIEIANYLNIDLQYLLSGGESLAVENTLDNAEKRQQQKRLMEYAKRLLELDVDPDKLESLIDFVEKMKIKD